MLSRALSSLEPGIEQVCSRPPPLSAQRLASARPCGTLPSLDSEPLFSAVIPAHDAEPFIGRALRSALAQDGVSLEVIVVDDGSTDRTAELAAAWDGPVRVIGQANAGVAAARNRGIREARGELIAFLDADDEWLPGHLARARAVLRDTDLQWYSAAYLRQHRDGRVVEQRPDERLLRDGDWFPDYFAICRNWINITDTMVIRREVFEEVGVFDTGLRRGEDLDLWFRIGLRHPRVGYSRELAAVYWWVRESLTRQGPYPTERALEIVRRGRESAAALGDEALARVQPILEQWLVEIIRQAALAGERDALREVAAENLAAVPLFWRLVSLAARTTPAPLWRALIRAWKRAR